VTSHAITIVYFKNYFYTIKIILATGKPINIEKLTFDETNERFITVT